MSIFAELKSNLWLDWEMCWRSALFRLPFLMFHQYILIYNSYKECCVEDKSILNRGSLKRIKRQILISLERGRCNVVLHFRRWLCRCSIHLSTYILVYRNLISKQGKYLLFISMSVNLLRSDPEFLMCVSQIVRNRGNNNLARGLGILWREILCQK